MHRSKTACLIVALGIGFLLAVSAWALPNSKPRLAECETPIRLPYKGSTHLDQNEMQYVYVKTTDYGHTWSWPQQAGDLSDLEDWNSEMYDFGSLCDDQNNLHFMGVLNGFADPANNGVYDVHTTDGGTTWVRTLIVAEGSNSYNWASEAQDTLGNLYCLIWGWDAGENTVFWGSKSTDHGMTWSAPIVIAASPTDISEWAEYPHLAEQASADYCFFIFQEEVAGYEQYAGRFPTDMSAGATIVNLQAESGVYYSYYIGACGPIAYDPTSNYLCLCFRNVDVSATAVYFSDDEGVTFNAAEIPGPQRYPSAAVDPYGQRPWIFSNVGVPAAGTYHHNWYAYDEGGYGSGLWTDQIPHDSLLYDGTRDLLYIHQGCFFDADNVITMCNIWGSFTPEGCLVNYSTDGGVTWAGGWKLSGFPDTPYICECQLDGGTSGVAYITFCAETYTPDLNPPIISNQTLVTPPSELGPYVVSADYWDDTAVDWDGYIWVNWICYSHAAQWNWAEQDSHFWTDPETYSGTYYFTIPDTHADGSPVRGGDTIWFYCDGYDYAGNYSSHEAQYFIAGQQEGPLSDTLGPGTYHIADTISVESGDSLILMPGTTFQFRGPYPFHIYGTLLAEGTESDSIIFTTDPETNPDRWRGLRFLNPGSSDSRLIYGLIENSSAIGSIYDNCGGAVFCDSSSPSLMHCTLTHNRSVSSGGAVYCRSHSSPTFTRCTVTSNKAESCGAGVACTNNSSPSFAQCTISDNPADFYGGGVYCISQSSPTFIHCTINGNESGCSDWADGGGVCCWESSPAFTHCVLSGNLAFGEGGAVFCMTSSPTFTNCTISGNSAAAGGDGVACHGSSPTFNSTTIALSDGEGIYFQSSSESEVSYCDIFGNSRGDIVFLSNNPSHGPPEIGQLVTTNANGDSCDTYMNIFLDPMFMDTVIGDYHLQVASPCIDAGDPTLPFDPDSTIADIGAFYFNQLDVDEVIEVLPTAFALHPNWPNPFNPITNIRYDIPRTGLVSVRVFNILGQEVATLAHGTIPAGSHIISWDASGLPSGIYFCILEARDFAQVQKLVLVK